MTPSPPLPAGGSGTSDASQGKSGSPSQKQPGQPLKRACDQCNLRRVKCSHEHPCAHCVRLRITCTYWKAARGKESSGKRIEKLRRDQALAAAAVQGTLGPAAGPSSGPSPFPLGSFPIPDSAHPYGTQGAKNEDVGAASHQAPHPPVPVQYAGPSAHFPPPAADQNRPEARLSSSSSHQQHASTLSVSDAGFASHQNDPSRQQPLQGQEAYASQSQTYSQQPQQGGGSQGGTHIPPAVFLGNAFFPPSLTTISPSTAANFRLPDLSTSLADEFNAQDPNARQNNFFDWGMGMLGGNPGAGAAGGQGGSMGGSGTADGASRGAHSVDSGSVPLSASHAGHSPADSLSTSIHHPGTTPSSHNIFGSSAGAAANGGAAPGLQPNAAQNARMNLYDWGLGMLASGVDASSLSPHASAGGSANGTGSATGSPAAHVGGLYAGAAPPGVGVDGARGRAVSFRDGNNDFALGLQQQEQQRLAQERQLRQQQQHQQQQFAQRAQMSSGLPANVPTSGQPGANMGTVTPGHALPPAMQGVLPSTLEILSGAHPLSETVLVPHIALYFERLHPIMPVFSRSWIFSKLDNGDQHSSVDFAAMLLAMSALALIQPQEAKERAQARMRVRKAKALLEESVRLRNAVLFGKNPTLESTMTSFYVFACLFGLGEDNPAWFRLHEAVALGLLLKLHEPKAYANLQRDEQERRLRAYWLLVITERAYSLQRGHSLGFRGHPERTTRTLRRQFGLEELEDFPHLQLKLFDAVDEDFVDCWNGRCEAAAGERCSRMDRERALKLWATFQQSEKEINDEVLAVEVASTQKQSAQAKGASAGTNGGESTATTSPSQRRPGSVSRSEDERQAEFERHKIQLADHRITAQWLLNRLWNLCLTHGHVDLSPASLNLPVSNSNKSAAAAVPPPFRLDAALRIARKMLAICHELSQSSMEAHGIGLMEKLYDVAMTLVLICRDFPALAKRIGLVDLNLKRGVGRGRERDTGEQGGDASGASASGVSGEGVGRRRLANGTHAGMGEDVSGVEYDESDASGGDYGRPAALSPSVPGFFYPLENEPGASGRQGLQPPGSSSSSSSSSTSTLAHPHLSMGAVMQQIPQGGSGGEQVVKREDGPESGSDAQGQRRGAAARPPPRSLRQAPTAIESILQEYVEIFCAFRAGDHPFLEKMVVAMKELVQGLPSRASGAGTGTGSGSGSGTAVPSPTVGAASSFAGGQAGTSVPAPGGGRRLINPLPSHLNSSHASTSTSTSTGSTAGAFSTPAPPHPASLSGGDAAAAAAAMQRASAYAYTPPATGASNSGVGSGTSASVDSLASRTPAYIGGSQVGTGPGPGPGSVESYLGASPGGASVQSFSGYQPSQRQPHHGHGRSQQGSMSGASNSGTMFHSNLGPHASRVSAAHASPAMSSPSGAGTFGSTPSAGVGLGVGAAPSPLSAATPGSVVGGGGPGMEWAQMPEDLGWPSFESFLRECGLWDTVGASSNNNTSAGGAGAPPG